MNLKLRHYGGTTNTPSSTIELIVDNFGNTLVADITNLKGEVNESLIAQLRDMADDLDAQNQLIKAKAL